ncbi:MAG: anti-sigma factor family protein [Blastocatellia bacterium]
MNSVKPQISGCPVEDISAYIDGELSPDRELSLEMHVMKCPSCAAELNRQKTFLRQLDSSLNAEPEIELPANFTRSIVVNAESKVNGLRHSGERFTAIFICVALAFFVLFSFGTAPNESSLGLWRLSEQVFAVFQMGGHLLYNFGLAIAIVVRTITFQVESNTLLWLVVSAVICAVAIRAHSRFSIRHKNSQ